MARLVKLCLSLLSVVLLFADFTVSVYSPAPAPESGGDGPFTQPPPGAPASQPSIISPSPDSNPSPAPAPADQAPSSSPTTPPAGPKPSPSEASEKGSSGGLNGGQKAGIAIGVVLGLGFVGFIGVVYKKRRDNIQRSQYGYAARRELL